jgi:hypothetical protein
VKKAHLGNDSKDLDEMVWIASLVAIATPVKVQQLILTLSIMDLREVEKLGSNLSKGEYKILIFHRQVRPVVNQKNDCKIFDAIR